MWKRGVAAVRRIAPTLPVSVDTFRSEVAARAIERFGPLIINDISAGELDPAMPAVAAKYGVPLHRHAHEGRPEDDAVADRFRRDIVTEVVGYFRSRLCDMEQGRASAAGGSSSTRASASPRPPRRTSNCLPDCTTSARWAVRCWRVFRASR